MASDLNQHCLARIRFGENTVLFHRTPSGVEYPEDTARNGTELGSKSSQL